VQKRLAHTFGWFSYGLFSTAASVYMLRNSMIWASVPWYVLLGSSFACLYAAHAVDHPFKAVAFTGFAGIMGLNILPLIQVSAAAAVADAALATGLSMASLGTIAYFAPSEQFLNWGGALGMASAGMLCVGLLGMFRPSQALFNIWLWGGLGLTGCFTLYNT